MAYRAPAVGVLHEWKSHGAAAITVTSEATGFEKDKVIDDQAVPLFRFNVSAADNNAELDRAAAGGTLNRVVIPAGHNLDGLTLDYETSASGAFGGEESTPVSIVVSGSGIIDEATGAGMTLRFQRVNFPDVAQEELGELFVTERLVFDRGPAPEWTDENRANVSERELRSGILYLIRRGSSARIFELTFERLTAADVAIFDAIETQSADGVAPFWFWPPDDAEDPIQVKLDDLPRRRQAHPNPQAFGQAPRIVLRMIEDLA